VNKNFKNAAIKDAVNDYFSGLGFTYFSNRMKSLEKCWTKCIKLKGDHVKKYN